MHRLQVPLTKPRCLTRIWYHISMFQSKHVIVPEKNITVRVFGWAVSFQIERTLVPFVVTFTQSSLWGTSKWLQHDETFSPELIEHATKAFSLWWRILPVICRGRSRLWNVQSTMITQTEDMKTCSQEQMPKNGAMAGFDMGMGFGMPTTEWETTIFPHGYSWQNPVKHTCNQHMRKKQMQKFVIQQSQQQGQEIFQCSYERTRKCRRPTSRADSDQMGQIICLGTRDGKDMQAPVDQKSQAVWHLSRHVILLF